MKIEIPITEAQRKEARVMAIRYSNSRKAVGTTDYAYRDLQERAEIGFLGEISYIGFYSLTKADGIGFDALTPSGKRVEIKVKTAWGIRPDYDIQRAEVGNHDLVVWLLYDETTKRLFWVGISYPKSERWAQSAVKVAFSEIQDPNIGALI